MPERSPLALYVLALANEEMAGDRPWTATDDPEDFFRVTLSCSRGKVHVRASQRFSGVVVEVTTEPDDPWALGLVVELEEVFLGVYTVGERQLAWHVRTHGGTVTPDGGEER